MVLPSGVSSTAGGCSFVIGEVLSSSFEPLRARPTAKAITTVSRTSEDRTSLLRLLRAPFMARVRRAFNRASSIVGSWLESPIEPSSTWLYSIMHSDRGDDMITSKFEV